MNKKNLYICPSTQVVLVQLEAMIAASAKVDGQPGLTPDPTPGDPGDGKSRRKDIWADPEEEEENENAYRF